MAQQELQLHGALTALVTPFDDAGRLDEARLQEQISHQLDAGIDGLVPVGTTGESPTLSFDEHKRVIELTVDAVAGKVPVVAGAGANNTEEAAELHGFAKSVGADAVLSVNPYYNKPSQEGLYRHFATLAERVDLPIVLYNIPGRCGVTMSPETVARLKRDTPIAAMKEATGDIGIVTRYFDACDDLGAGDLVVLSGDDPLTLPMLALGGRGVISVASNVAPKLVGDLCRECLAGNFGTAHQLHRDVCRLSAPLFLDGNPAGVKHAMKLQGRDTGVLRLPLVGVSDNVTKKIEAAVALVTGGS
ncbi:MAG: 4-hydroxy-tetrahydrodipicolinate synthase [Planctomycetota bacterium]